MKIDVTQVMKKFDGADVEISKGASEIQLCPECTMKMANAKESFTFRMLCTRALTNITQTTQKLPGEKKFERGQLAAKIYNNDEPDLTIDELKTLKDAIGETDGPLLVYQAFQIIEGKPEDS